MDPTLYIETTIVSYLTAWPSRDVVTLARQQQTREWWESRRSGFALFCSELVEREAASGDPVASAERLKVLAGILRLSLGPAVEPLTALLIDSLRLPSRAQPDALHVAIAATNGIHYLLNPLPADVELPPPGQRRAAARDRIGLQAGGFRAAGHLHPGGADGAYGMNGDPIVDEVRRVGEAYFAQFHFDLRAVCEDLRRRSAEAGRETVTLPPRPAQPATSQKPIEGAKKAS